MQMMKVIGAGLGRTGTKSTQMALQMLGFDKCYHMTELMEHGDGLAHWQEALKTGSTDWEVLFQGYLAAVDYPSALFYEDQMKRYPDAKVLLNVRDPERWYESVYSTIYVVSRGRFRMMMSIMRNFIPFLRDLYPRFAFVNELIWDGQFEGRFTDKDFAITKFKAWNESVIATVPEDKLLVYEVKQGWEPLCDFLGVPIPDEDFPRVNSREEFRAMVRQRNPLNRLLNRGS